MLPSTDGPTSVETDVEEPAIFVGHATAHGSTQQLADRLARRLPSHGFPMVDANL